MPVRSSVDVSEVWRPAFVRLDDAPDNAEAVRLNVIDVAKDRGRLGISALGATGWIGLDRLMQTAGVSTLVDPGLRPHFPCAKQPPIVGGVVQIPEFAIESRRSAGQALTLLGRSPFFMEVDALMYPFDVLPVRVRRSGRQNEPVPADIAVTVVRRDRLALYNDGR